MQNQQNTIYGNSYGPGSQMQNQNSMNNSGFQSIGMQNQQRIQPTFLPGRVVTGEADIFASEVPMDGNIGVFVQQNLQKVYVKKWGGDGRIYTNVYELANGPQQEKEDPVALILARLDQIEERLKSDKPKYSNSRPPKKTYRGSDNRNQNKGGNAE